MNQPAINVQAHAPSTRAAAPRRPHRRTFRVHPAGHILLTIYALIVLVPLLFVVYLSFKTLGGIVGTPLGPITRPQVSNYSTAWTEGTLSTYLVNSLIVSLSSVAIILVFASFAAFTLSRYHFKGNHLILLLFVSGMAMPVQIVALPLFSIMKEFGLLNNLTSLIIAYGSIGLSFSIFLFVNFMRSVPMELQESITIDGAGPIRIYWSLILPLIRPAIAIVAIFQFLTAWKDFFLPLLFIQAPSRMTVAVGLLNFVGEYGTQWQFLLPALVIVSIPSVIGFLLVSRQLQKGLLTGSMKL